MHAHQGDYLSLLLCKVPLGNLQDDQIWVLAFFLQTAWPEPFEGCLEVSQNNTRTEYSVRYETGTKAKRIPHDVKLWWHVRAEGQGF